MNADALVLGLLAIADLVVFANLRQLHAQRQAQRLSEERVTASLTFAVHRANSVEEMAEPPQLEQAS